MGDRVPRRIVQYFLGRKPILYHVCHFIIVSGVFDEENADRHELIASPNIALHCIGQEYFPL